MAERPAAFWSYTHDDNRLDSDRIFRLAKSVKDEYELLTGIDLELFVDRTAIEWGQRWRQRIDEALSATTFFIPLITPRFFTSQQCRNELITFAGHAKSLGVTDLLLPILYVRVPGLADDQQPSSDDEAIALVSETQWSDWRALRLEDETSGTYRRAVNSLAVRLADVAERIESIPVSNSSTSHSSGMSGLRRMNRMEATMSPASLNSSQTRTTRCRGWWTASPESAKSWVG